MLSSCCKSHHFLLLSSTRGNVMMKSTQSPATRSRTFHSLAAASTTASSTNGFIVASDQQQLPQPPRRNVVLFRKAGSSFHLQFQSRSLGSSLSTTTTTNIISSRSASTTFSADTVPQSWWTSMDQRLLNKVVAHNETIAKLDLEGFDLRQIAANSTMYIYKRLDWESDIAPVMDWLAEIGLSKQEAVQIASRNPDLFKKSIQAHEEDLKVIGELIGVTLKDMYEYLKKPQSIVCRHESEPES